MLLLLILWVVASLPFPLYGQESDEQPDYTSKVLQYFFPATLEAQEEALKTNPMMQRFAESREELSDDPYRPIYHFVNPEGTMNDPNGFSYWNGNWHLFYQAAPPEDRRQHWGHAVSKNLVHWRDLPLAIYPGPESASYSGSALVEDDRVIAIYDGVRAGVMVAESDDPLLLNWKKITGEAVIPLDDELPIPPIVEGVRIGDPFLWKKEGTYYAIVGYMKDQGADDTQFDIYDYGTPGNQVRANYLFKSDDLKNWEYLHPFVEGDRFTKVGDDGSCPYFWPIGDRHILLFFSHSSVSQYLLGDYDKERDKFVATSHGNFNHGLRFGPGGIHAPSATPDSNGGVITIFNMNSAYPTKGWNQIMSLPMRLTLRGEDELGFEPAGDIESLRGDHKKVERMKLPANDEVVFNDIKGNAMEIQAEIDPKNAQYVEINVLRSPNKEEYTRIVFFKNRGQTNRDRGGINDVIMIDATHSSILPDAQMQPPQIAQMYLESNENLELQIFIDKSVVEVYANGKQYVAMRVYPGLEESVGVSMRSQGKDSELISLDAWQMENIYK